MLPSIKSSRLSKRSVQPSRAAAVALLQRLPLRPRPHPRPHPSPRLSPRPSLPLRLPLSLPLRLLPRLLLTLPRSPLRSSHLSLPPSLPLRLLSPRRAPTLEPPQPLLTLVGTPLLVPRSPLRSLQLVLPLLVPLVDSPWRFSALWLLSKQLDELRQAMKSTKVFGCVDLYEAAIWASSCN